MINHKEIVKEVTYLVQFALVIIYSSWVCADLWNGIVATTFDIQRITIAQALGLDIFVSYLVATLKEYESDEKDRDKALLKCLNMAFSAWFFGHIAMLFM